MAFFEVENSLVADLFLNRPLTILGQEFYTQVSHKDQVLEPGLNLRKVYISNIPSALSDEGLKDFLAEAFG